MERSTTVQQQGFPATSLGDLKACQSRFDLRRDVPTCSGAQIDARNGQCLSAERKPIYSSCPFDSGVDGSNWREWKFASPPTRDAGAVGFIFATPPLDSRPGGLAFALGFDMDRDAPSIYAASAIYSEALMSFMPPPNGADLARLRDRGGKLIVYHGTSDPVFSADDTAAWFERLRASNGGDASGFARYFPVPGMNHCAGGPATDQFDMLSALVDWVEQGHAPASVVASREE